MDLRHEQDALLLAKLLEKPGCPLTRSDLAAHADIPPADLEAHLLPYAQAGYPVNFHPQGTISLDPPPDVWCAEEIRGRTRAHSPQGLVWNPVLLEETASTNDVARDLARRGAKTGLVVAATRQTRGRGRLGRTWESPPGCGLYVSILLRPDWPTDQAGRLTILASVATMDAVEAVTGVLPQLKWPNDLLLGGRKLAGLLTETEARAGQTEFAVLGIGLNVNHTLQDFSLDVLSLATSLRIYTGQTYRRADVLVALLHALGTRLTQPFGVVREAWASSSLTLGQRVTLSTARGKQSGQAFGLDDSGALLVRSENGEIEAIHAGDLQVV